MWEFLCDDATKQLIFFKHGLNRFMEKNETSFLCILKRSQEQ